MVSHQCLPHFESKSYQVNFPLNPPRQDLSNNTKGTFLNSPEIFSYDLILISEEIIQELSRTFVHKSKRHGTQKSDVT
jgi:hypothetical protein